MKKNAPLEIEQMDLATLLGCLASDLRNTGLAVGELGPDHGHTKDMDRLAGSLDRVATLLEAVGDHLCPACGLQMISEQIRFEKPRRRAEE